MATRAKAAAPARKPGRPSKYQGAYPEQARKLCLLGATNDELAEFFEVAVSTLSLWLKTIPEFSESVQKGRRVADAEVADRLYQRALGYEHDDVDIRVVDHVIVKTKLRKYYPPDTAAAFIWLKNRQPAKWRDKAPEGSDVTPDQVAALARAAIAAATATDGDAG